MSPCLLPGAGCPVGLPIPTNRRATPCAGTRPCPSQRFLCLGPCGFQNDFGVTAPAVITWLLASSNHRAGMALVDGRDDTLRVCGAGQWPIRPLSACANLQAGPFDSCSGCGCCCCASSGSDGSVRLLLLLLLKPLPTRTTPCAPRPTTEPIAAEPAALPRVVPEPALVVAAVTVRVAPALLALPLALLLSAAVRHGERKENTPPPLSL